MNMEARDRHTEKLISLASSKEKESAWECIKKARMQNRPQAQDYIKHLFTDTFETKGDRVLKDDASIITAVARFDGMPVTVIGQQKGHTLQERMHYHFGMPHPEGYRKSMRALEQAQKFNRPVICLVDTPGAYCGIEAEERGQGLLIAEHLQCMSMLSVPTISVIIGEGGSGGALALALSDRLIMMENSYFSVISPEGCASILFKDSAKAPQAAESLKLTARDLLGHDLADCIIPETEPFSIYHMEQTIENLKKVLASTIQELNALDRDVLLQKRHQKYLDMKGC